MESPWPICVWPVFSFAESLKTMPSFGSDGNNLIQNWTNIAHYCRRRNSLLIFLFLRFFPTNIVRSIEREFVDLRCFDVDEDSKLPTLAEKVFLPASPTDSRRINLPVPVKAIRPLLVTPLGWRRVSFLLSVFPHCCSIQI